MYYPDLTSYEYSHDPCSQYRNALNIGWIEHGQDYTTGAVAADLLDKVGIISRWVISLMRGFHSCDLCPTVACNCLIAQCSAGEIHMGSGEIRAFDAEGGVYAAPTLLYHYMREHAYCPPAPFLRAVEGMANPPNGSVRIIEGSLHNEPTALLIARDAMDRNWQLLTLCREKYCPRPGIGVFDESYSLGAISALNEAGARSQVGSGPLFIRDAQTGSSGTRYLENQLCIIGNRAGRPYGMLYRWNGGQEQGFCNTSAWSIYSIAIDPELLPMLKMCIEALCISMNFGIELSAPD